MTAIVRDHRSDPPPRDATPERQRAARIGAMGGIARSFLTMRCGDPLLGIDDPVERRIIKAAMSGRYVEGP